MKLDTIRLMKCAFNWQIAFFNGEFQFECLYLICRKPKVAAENFTLLSRSSAESVVEVELYSARVKR